MIETEEREQKVTPLELFFDLVFVFAITQVTRFMADGTDWQRLLDGMAILAVLWWAWSCYAWLGNTAGSDEGTVRLVLLTAMAAILLVSLAVPQAFDEDALLFGIAYAAVRILHLVAYWVVGRDDPSLRGLTLVLARSMVPAAGFVLLAGFLDGTAQTVCWVLAVTVDFLGLLLSGVDGWRVQAAHFAERHGLIIIIALGESIVSIGVGAEGTGLTGGVILAALLGFTVAAALWWAYFDVVALAAERRFDRAHGAERARIARDSFTYAHLPMVAGIILLALGLKKTIGHGHEPLADPERLALCGGVALYLLGHVLFRLRHVRSLGAARLVTAVLLLALVPFTGEVDALPLLAVVAAACVGLIGYERLRYAELRDRVRHQYVA